MANGVNIKMGVSGIAQFKQNMTVAKNSVKTLDEALKLNEKQFKATGDAEEYMKTKSELLKKKIEEQKAIVAQAEKALDAMTRNGVDKASKSFQDMQQQLLRAKSGMLDAETALGNIGVAAEEADSGITGLKNDMDGIGKKISFKTITDGIDTITSGLEKAARKAWELGTKIVKATLGGGSWADDLQEMADKYELSPEDMYRIQQTANIIDISVDSILGAKQRMEKTIGAGSSETADILQQLGLSTAVDTDPDEQFWKIGEAIMQMGDAYERENAAQKLFGKSWRELIPLFKTGREEYEKTNASWSWIGDEQFNSLTKMDDQYKKLQSEWETFQLTMEAALAGPMTEGMETLTGLVKEFNNYLQSDKGQEMLKQLGDTVSSLLQNLTSIDPAKIIEGFNTAVDTVVKSLKWLEENKDNVVGWLEAILGGWATLKITGGALKILNLLNGLQWLKSNPNIQLPGTDTGTGGVTQAAASGGVFTMAQNALTGAAAKVSSFLANTGNLMPVLGDRLLNETNVGRAIRDGGDILEGLSQDFKEKGEEINKNLETFVDDWNNNVIVKAVTDRSENQDAADRGPWGANWAPSYMGGYGMSTDDVARSINRMNEITEEMINNQSGSNGNSENVNSWWDKAMGLPGQITSAIYDAISQVRLFIDGQVAGQILTPYISFGMAGNLLEMTQ